METFLTFVAYALICFGSVGVVCEIYDRGEANFERARQAEEFSKPWQWVCPRCMTPNNDNFILTSYMGQKVQGGCQVCFEIEQAEKEIFIGEERSK